MARRILTSMAQWALVALLAWGFAALAGRALDNELDAHSHAAFGAAYDPAD